jgi:FdhD protein
MKTTMEVSMIRFALGAPEPSSDRLAVEEPLEIRLDGHPIAVLMRTPAADRELTTGFLITEGIISSLDQIRKIDVRPAENRSLVFLVDGVVVDPGRLTRQLFTGSSCGLCGKATLDAIFTAAPPIRRPLVVSNGALLAAPAKLRAAQADFGKTGGLHAAGLFSQTGELLVCHEDIGRHNAVDKIIGHALLEHIDPTECFLLVSGRISFEIMQKSLCVGIPTVAAISAPSSLAVEFAKRSGQTLVAFLRPPSFNLYSSS